MKKTTISLVSLGLLTSSVFAVNLQDIKVTKDNILYLCGWSPFEDHEFKGAVTETVLNGEIVYSNGNFKNQLPIGMQIEFNR